MVSDEALMLEFRSGSHQAFEELYARYREPLYHAILSTFVRTITKHGVTQGIFIEGGLTREGAFLKPKLGMLDYIVTSKRDPESAAWTRKLYVAGPWAEVGVHLKAPLLGSMLSGAVSPSALLTSVAV